jgi:hypothetical protein
MAILEPLSIDEWSFSLNFLASIVFGPLELKVGGTRADKTTWDIQWMTKDKDRVFSLGTLLHGLYVALLCP